MIEARHFVETHPPMCENTVFLITAGQQTQGYGRRGSVWVSEKGNFYATLLIPLSSGVDPSFFPFVFSSWIAQTLNKTFFIPLKLKWPNDFLLNHQKVGGMIGEIFQNFFFLGIGFNVHKAPTSEKTYKTTSFHENNAMIECDHITQLFKSYFCESFVHDMAISAEDIRERWNLNAYGLNKRVTFSMDHKPLQHGIFKGIFSDGALHVIQNTITVRCPHAHSLRWEDEKLFQ
jgi:BirA family biotin operon repressor/biotin-[acetyl-CoA-carboxylase] ligase